ncbi:unnamed protein product [Bursaphelenchus xylophilus]|uniref:beta-mannosidase n=2 Tax=Bursaphelenchus xylophilus TaxID=6326 RepID=A0A811KZA3_BURXY|nr:unnamed protein product [Bursaphelenchus xylophilus]CAG9107975.1 unnamed protein product [Bursaphelenchus xylophilus]
METVVLELKGLDTIASIYLASNETFIGKTENMFRSYSFLVDNSMLMEKENGIIVLFESAVDYAQKKYDEYQNATGNKIPPVESPKAQKGDPHVNFIRKTQSSFSWDWGPSWPTQGFYQPVYLHTFTHFKLSSFSPYIYFKDGGFQINVQINYFCNPNLHFDLQAHIEIDELKFARSYVKNEKCNTFEGYVRVTEHIRDRNIKLWYPRGYGEQKLYNITLTMASEQGSESISKLVGFKKVRLEQNLIDETDPKKGKEFAYYVNDIPIFLKGANMIPASLFPSKFTQKDLDFLILSVKEANMNTLRVWGGGEWLREEFIAATDEAGILVFHDLTFACALYPTDDDFIGNIKEEITEQVLRLRSHASLLTFSGNNEIETAIRSQWWPSETYNETKQVKDYLKLMKVALETVNEVYPNGIITRSSPSNGGAKLEVDRDPNSDFFGDIHFYNELTNLWKPYNLPTPRCATEFGVPSFPLSTTMKKYVEESEYTYFSKSMMARNRHFLGLFTLPLMVANHFTFDVSDSLGSFSFLSQIHQAITLKTQIEHYRSQRSVLERNGKGKTMCALYWQLNDVWSGITWSTLDFDQRWKVAHYYVKKAFDEVIVSMYIDKDGSLKLFVINDLLTPLHDAKLIIRGTKLNSKFSKRVLSESTINVPPLSSQKITISTDAALASYFIEASLMTNNISKVSVLPPNYLSQYSIGNVDISINGIVKTTENTYKLKLRSSDVVPYVWLDLRPELLTKDIRYYFSDNGFIVLDTLVTVTLTVTAGNITEITEKDITLCWIYKCN